MSKVCVRCHNRNSTWDRPEEFTTTESVANAYGISLNKDILHVTVEDSVCYYCQRRELELITQGYTEVIELSGKIGCSELGMHCKIAELHGVVARLRPGVDNYAYVLTSDGRWTQGVFHYFGEGEFSLS